MAILTDGAKTVNPPWEVLLRRIDNRFRGVKSD